MTSIGNYTNENAPQLSFAFSAKTREQWESYENKIDGQIVFLYNDKTIYFQGNYFGLSEADSTKLDKVVSDLSTLRTAIGDQTEAFTTLKGAQASLAQGLLILKQELDTKIGSTTYDGASITAAIALLQSTVSNISNSLYATDIALSSTDPTTIKAALDGKVLISTDDTTVKQNSQISGSSLTSTSAIATAIENAHTAAVNASGNADTKIAKSSSATAVKASGASSSITGITPNSLQTGENIAQAIEDAIVARIGTSNDWKSGENQTLGQLRSLIAALDSTVTGMDNETAARITTIIKELRQVGDDETDDFANTILDALHTLLGTSTDNQGQGSVGGYYNIETGTQGQVTYANTLQGIIDALESLIATKVSAAQSGAIDSSVTSVKATGATVTGTDAGGGAYKGNVNLTIDSSTVKITTALTGGATTAANSSVQQALQDISNTAGSAQTAANTALSMLQWVVI